MRRARAWCAAALRAWLACLAPGCALAVRPDGAHDAAATTRDEGARAAEDAGDECFPPCLRRLFGTCFETYPCVVQQDVDGPRVDRICYANGLRILQTSSDGGQAALVQLASHAGQTCWTRVRQTTASGEYEYTYADPRGTLVAVVHPVSRHELDVACDGATYRYDPESPACVALTGRPGFCAGGRCAP